MRAPKSQLLNRDAYEFFAGRTETGEAIWTTDVKARQPVIEEANGIRLVSAAYNAGLDRYLITYSFGDESLHNIAILDAPTPWGPYTTAMYDTEWGVGRFTGTCCLIVSFAPKWWLDGGKRFTVVFSGGDGADSWNTVEGTFRVNGTAPAAGTITPVLQASTSSAADPQRTAQKARRQPVKTKRPEPQGPLARSRSSQPDGGEGASTPDGTAPPAPKPRRQIYVSASPPTNLQLPSATDAKPAQQGRGMASAKGEAATALAAGEKRALAGASPAPPPVPAQNTAEIAGANKSTPTRASSPRGASIDEPRERTSDNGKTKVSSAAAAPLNRPPMLAGAEHVPPKAAPDLASDRASTTTSAALPLPPALEGAQPSPGPRVNAVVPRRPASLSASRQPTPAAPVRETVPEAASTSYDAPSELRLVGTMVHGRDSLAIVVPVGASDSITVRPGDMLGPWSVASIERHTLALRAGDRALELHLFQGAEELGDADIAQ
jgi:hypothetical protein